MKLPSPQEINAVIRLFNEGRDVEAATLAHAMTMRFPRHGFGWKALGAVLMQQGNNADALPALRQSAALPPQGPMRLQLAIRCWSFRTFHSATP